MIYKPPHTGTPKEGTSYCVEGTLQESDAAAWYYSQKLAPQAETCTPPLSEPSVCSSSSCNWFATWNFDGCQKQNIHE